MNINYIVSEIFAGRDGSYNPVFHKVPTTGYMVGGASWTLTVPVGRFGGEMVYDFVTAHIMFLRDPRTGEGDRYIGWWTHEGRVYLDVSDNVTDKSEAVRLGRLRKEISVWDIEKGEEIPCLITIRS